MSDRKDEVAHGTRCLRSLQTQVVIRPDTAVSCLADMQYQVAVSGREAPDGP
jgi:hypothetical protein